MEEEKPKDPKDMTLSEIIEVMVTTRINLHDRISNLGNELPDQPYSNSQMAQRYTQQYEEAMEPLKKELDKREQLYQVSRRR